MSAPAARPTLPDVVWMNPGISGVEMETGVGVGVVTATLS